MKLMLSTLVVLVAMAGMVAAGDVDVRPNEQCKEQATFVARSLMSSSDVPTVKQIFYCQYSADRDQWTVYVDVDRKDGYVRKCYTQIKKGPNGWRNERHLLSRLYQPRMHARLLAIAGLKERGLPTPCRACMRGLGSFDMILPRLGIAVPSRKGPTAQVAHPLAGLER